jgi:hypothetical protein
MVFLMVSCNSQESSKMLIKVAKDESHGLEAQSAYLNLAGDTIIPFGKYAHCFSDTIKDFGVVVQQSTGKMMGINQNGVELFEVFKYDNGPDMIEDGLFRMIKNGKIGYADAKGNVIIEPSFDCAYPFENGYARVSQSCDKIKDGEHTTWISDDWYHISKDGKRVDK